MLELKLADGSDSVKLPEDRKKAARFLADTIINQGRAPGQEKRLDWSDFYEKVIKDTVSYTHLLGTPLIQTTIETMLREPVEPIMVMSGLFNRVMTKGLDIRVIGGALGAVYAEDVEEGSNYPEVMFQVSGGLQTAHIGKSGIQASFTDEALRYTTWDIMSINLRLMKNAMIRHREQKAAAMLTNLGTPLFDNVQPAASLFGVMTGRGIDLQPNGSFIMDDLFKAMAHMAEEGFPPDILLVNPQTFYLFIQDPVMRGMMMSHGGGRYFGGWSGEVGPRAPWGNQSMGLSGPTLGTAIVPGGNASGDTPTGIVGREHGMTATFQLPSYSGMPITVMSSPFVPFDPTTQLSDMFLISSGNVGLLLQDEDMVSVEWREEDRELTKLRLRERYAFHVGYEGMGVGVLKNVPLKRNYFDGVVQATNVESLEEISPTESIDL